MFRFSRSSLRSALNKRPLDAQRLTILRCFRISWSLRSRLPARSLINACHRQASTFYAHVEARQRCYPHFRASTMWGKAFGAVIIIINNNKRNMVLKNDHTADQFLYPCSYRDSSICIVTEPALLYITSPRRFSTMV